MDIIIGRSGEGINVGMATLNKVKIVISIPTQVVVFILRVPTCGKIATAIPLIVNHKAVIIIKAVVVAAEVVMEDAVIMPKEAMAVKVEETKLKAKLISRILDAVIGWTTAKIKTRLQLVLSNIWRILLCLGMKEA